MASISKIIRSSNEAPSHLTINEWFHYASSSISAVGQFLFRENQHFETIDLFFSIGLRDFPIIDDTNEPTNTTLTNKIRSKQFEKTAESIFILPSLELRFQTCQNDGKHLLSLNSMFVKIIGQS